MISQHHGVEVNTPRCGEQYKGLPNGISTSRIKPLESLNYSHHSTYYWYWIYRLDIHVEGTGAPFHIMLVFQSFSILFFVSSIVFSLSLSLESAPFRYAIVGAKTNRSMLGGCPWGEPRGNRVTPPTLRWLGLSTLARMHRPTLLSLTSLSLNILLTVESSRPTPGGLVSQKRSVGFSRSPWITTFPSFGVLGLSLCLFCSVYACSVLRSARVESSRTVTNRSAFVEPTGPQKDPLLPGGWRKHRRGAPGRNGTTGWAMPDGTRCGEPRKVGTELGERLAPVGQILARFRQAVDVWSQAEGTFRELRVSWRPFREHQFGDLNVEEPNARFPHIFVGT